MENKFEYPAEEKFFTELIGKDSPELIPDPAIKERLMYNFSLKRRQQYRINSFAGLLASLLNFQHLGLKAGLITTALVFTLLTGKFSKENSPFLQPEDTTAQVSSFPYNPDYDSAFAPEDSLIY